ncbi:uncharacterized protein (TIGR00369 family) [Pararhizobium capsulatum DSM 1112]|uniref:Uncharacterized protein (TIGR00369 family) n=1 Tax=Pararhizobium capsulatum DSM 1112 TaxID=1121113 RepID=A0ABU0BN79_9HYPH|nr:PaaI family thioesterase [Pararhizobium capsulatum]MDQ0319710.1 uncharacterized protein (TIGR00369 family) [Pararhizobium capsulatum DSM 1112]
MTVEIYPGVTVPGIGTLPLEVIAQQSGLEAMQGLLDGNYPAPPMAATLKFTLTEVEEGRVVFKGLPTAEYLNPLGTVHGGWAATIMDSALGCVVMTALKAGEAYTTIEFKVNLVRPLLPGMGEVFCEGKIVHRGRTIATSECWLRDGKGKLLAHGTETCVIFPIENLTRG